MHSGGPAGSYYALDLGDLAPAIPCMPDLASSNIATGIASGLCNLRIRVFFLGPMFATYGASACLSLHTACSIPRGR
jgi:hypothetical protein